jgi:hypothetical protein
LMSGTSSGPMMEAGSVVAGMTAGIGCQVVVLHVKGAAYSLPLGLGNLDVQLGQQRLYFAGQEA